ncbi:MAG TPA: TMEM175 family protein [Vicinamibacterales bacterium]|nr:TMEM175 family protein [Vicinamibacterales bacterium]
MSIRHREASRLEGFSDAVFGFALTLLVVSLETPRTFAELRELLQQFLPFALTFSMVCWIWYEHNLFFRRYGLQDAFTVFLNCLLLFVVLFYVYPLKFLTSSLVDTFVFHKEGFEGTEADGHLLMWLYSLGVLLIFLTFIALHMHAWRQRAALALTPTESLQLRFRIRSHAISAGLAAVSILLVLILPHRLALAGLVYGLMGPLHAWNGYAAGKAHAALAQT